MYVVCCCLTYVCFILFIDSAHDLQDVHENIANVQVELESRVDVVLFGVLVSLAADDHLRVDGQKDGHHESTQATVDGLEYVVANENARDAKAEEHEEKANGDEPAVLRKVKLGLHRDESHAGGEQQRDANCDDDGLYCMIGRHEPEHDC